MGRYIFLAVGAVAVILAAVAAGVVHWPRRSPATAVATGDAAIGGAFRLVDQDGRPVDQTTLNGKPAVIYFGFTFCPEICPTTLASMGRWIRDLGPDADRLNFVFVTIDPERDTPAQMRLYLSSFDRHIRGYSGSPAQIAAMAKAWRVYYRKVPTGGGDYTMDHSTPVYLMDAKGHFAGLIAYQESEADSVAVLKALLNR